MSFDIRDLCRLNFHGAAADLIMSEEGRQELEKILCLSFTTVLSFEKYSDGNHKLSLLAYSDLSPAEYRQRLREKYSASCGFSCFKTLESIAPTDGFGNIPVDCIRFVRHVS